jgi:hypothetical protein
MPMQRRHGIMSDSRVMATIVKFQNDVLLGLL